MKTAHQNVPYPQNDPDVANKKYVDDHSGGGGGSDTSAADVLTWRPGSGETGPIVFDSFSALYTQLDTLRTAAVDSGEFTIVFDDVDGACDIPSGPWDMDRTAWVSVRGRDQSVNPRVAVIPLDGASITNLTSISGLRIQQDGAAGSIPIVLDGQTLNLYNTQLNGSASSYPYAFAALVHVTSRASIRLDDQSSISNGPEGGGTILIDGGIILDLFLDGSFATIADSVFNGGASAQVTVQVGNPSASYSFGQAYWTGTATITQQSGDWRNTGTPNGVVLAARGTLYSDTSSGVVYRNTDDATTWTPLDTGIAGVGVQYEPSTPASPPAETAFSKVLLTPDGTKGFVTNYNNDTRPIYAFRTSDNKFTATISGVGNGPLFAVVTPDGAKVYTVNYYDSSVTVIDAVTNAIITTITGFTSPAEAVALPDGSEVWVADFGANQILRIDTATDTIVGSPIATGSLPWHMTVLPNGTKVYVTDGTGIRAISTSSHTIVGTVATGANGITAKDNATVYINGGLGGPPYWGVQRIDTATDTLIGSPITTGNGGQDIAVKPGGAYIYALNAYDSTCSVIDTTTNLTVATVTGLISNPQYITINPAGTYAYVTNQGSTSISVIDLNTNIATNSAWPFVTPDTVTVGTFQTLDATGMAPDDLGGGVVLLGPAVIFDGVAGTDFQNIRSDRDSQSPIDNAKAGITNFGQATGDFGPSTGATGDGSTIGGGDDNSAGPIGYETVAGGAKNVANGDSATVSGGYNNQSTADGATVGGGYNNQSTATGATVSGGENNQAQGVDSCVPGGSQNAAKGDNSSAEGYQTATGGNASHAEGRQTTASGDYSHAEGYGSSADQDAAHAEGQSTIAGGNGAHSEGYSTQASGLGAHAEGRETVANTDWTHAEGLSNTANGPASHAEGILSQSFYSGQHAHGSGPGTTSGIVSERGASQHTVFTMAGATPGAGVGETVELDFGLFGDLWQPDFFFEGIGYTVVVTAIARGQISGTYRVQSFRQMFCIISDGGVNTLVASGTQEKIGNAEAASWTLTGSISVTPYSHFKLAFFTGTTQSQARITAKVETVDIYNPL